MEKNFVFVFEFYFLKLIVIYMLNSLNVVCKNIIFFKMFLIVF